MGWIYPPLGPRSAQFHPSFYVVKTSVTSISINNVFGD